VTALPSQFKRIVIAARPSHRTSMEFIPSEPLKPIVRPPRKLRSSESLTTEFKDSFTSHWESIQTKSEVKFHGLKKQALCLKVRLYSPKPPSDSSSDIIEGNMN